MVHMGASPPVHKNIVVDKYHRHFVLPTGGDSPSSQPICTTNRGGDVLLITTASPYEPAVKTFFTASL
jgi:hypothetical protein